jgi:GT2 family glycosyltransferase
MTPQVSVVVPSIGTRGAVLGAERVFVVEAVRSVLVTADVPVEVLVVAGRGMPADVTGRLRALGDEVRLVDFDAPFNFSATIDVGAAHAAGTHLLILNDDTEVVSSGWLGAMVDALRSPDGERPVGAVGAKLLFADGTLQHAGHTYRTSLDHVGFGLPGDAPGRDGILTRRREVAGVTAACMLTPFSVFDAVGGLSTKFPGNYNDVDYCMKLRLAGYAVVYEPSSVLYHFESRSRVAAILPEEIDLIQRRWLSHLVDDPFTPASV